MNLPIIQNPEHPPKPGRWNVMLSQGHLVSCVASYNGATAPTGLRPWGWAWAAFCAAVAFIVLAFLV